MYKRSINIDNNYKEQQTIKKYYKELFDQEADVYSKLLALDFLSYLVKVPEHRERLEYLYNRETNECVKDALKEVLDGEYQALDYNQGLFSTELQEIIDEVEAEKLARHKEVVDHQSRLLPFRMLKTKF